MPYYHVYIIDRDTHKKEFDFLKEQLMKYIIEPYSLGRRFMFRGSLVAPSNIRTIRIIETEQPSSELLDKIKTERGILKRLVLEGNDFKLLERKGRDVTREVLFGEKQRQRKKTLIPLSKNIFIVHGRDLQPIKELKTMLSDLGLNPIVLHEKASGGLTLAEKLEKYSEDVGYAFIILTPDDIGCEESKVKKFKSELEGPFLNRPLMVSKGYIEAIFKRLKPRARQNVIFEMGYFWGLLKRQKVCCLLKGDVEKPSDIEGIVYIPFKESLNEKTVRSQIIKELIETGYKIEVKKQRKDKKTEERLEEIRKEVKRVLKRLGQISQEE